MPAWICKELSASGTVSIRSHRPSAWRIPPLILLYSVELCAYSSPRIFTGACVLCSAGNMRKNSKWLRQPVQLLSWSHNGRSWIAVHLVNVMPLRLVLSLAALMCAHICANGAWRNCLLEALVYQLFWSVIVIANGFSRGLATIKQAWMEFAKIVLMKCYKRLLNSSLGAPQSYMWLLMRGEGCLNTSVKTLCFLKT